MGGLDINKCYKIVIWQRFVKMGYLNKKYLQRQLDLMPRGASAGRRSEMEEPSRPPLSLSGLLSSYQGYFIRLVPRLACQIVCNVRCYMY